MKRAGRWVFNFAAVISVGLLLLVCAVWPVSYFRSWTFGKIEISQSKFEILTLQCYPGRLVWFAAAGDLVRPAALSNEGWKFRWSDSVLTADPLSPPKPGTLTLFGFGYRRETSAPPIIPQTQPNGIRSVRTAYFIPNYKVVVPFWAILLASTLLPGIWLKRFRRRSDTPHLCATCGYDLRATPLRCPECGTIREGTVAVGTEVR